MLHGNHLRARHFQPVFRAAGLFGAGTSIGVVTVLAYNWIRFGTPFETGYSAAGAYIEFQTPLLYGLHGILLSSGKSIFLYPPPLLLALFGIRAHLRRHRPEALLALALAATYVVFYARSNAWHGDWCWGARYQSPWLPFMLLALGSFLEKSRDDGSRRRAVLGAVFAAGVVVQLLGVSVAYEAHLNTVPRVEAAALHQELSEAHFLPRFSPLLGHAKLGATFWREAWHLFWNPPTPTAVTFSEGWYPVDLQEAPMRRSDAEATLLVTTDPGRAHTLTLDQLGPSTPGAASVAFELDGSPVIATEIIGAAPSTDGAIPLAPGQWVQTVFTLPAGKVAHELAIKPRFTIPPPRHELGIAVRALTLDGNRLAMDGPFSWRGSGFLPKNTLVYRSLDFWWVKPLYSDLPRALWWGATAQLLLAVVSAVALWRQVRHAPEEQLDPLLVRSPSDSRGFSVRATSASAQ